MVLEDPGGSIASLDSSMDIEEHIDENDAW
jgi:hypothetical protein